MTTSKDLSSKFRHIRLLLARDKGHPEGDRQEGYDLLAPLTGEGRIDVQEWRSHRGSCRVRRFRTGEEDLIGRLRRKPGGQWFFDYADGDRDDEIGFHLGDELFVTGEYVSVERNGAMHTYQVARVERP
ncbi:hypothetical protein FJ970_12320 [Mesorhizobium sp. B2-1-8]|uniref:hypothetical protein n=1 Tax=unclassified Mesorhizobium TaxID=325217 RepID=UPI0011276F55|nr:MULTISPECIES: hypothetical protein [unclassified Mesorhizobium]MBZ9672285.1 hypothetical protein [Mesorhizobium sp. ES1-3]MBZ9706209.1 hypothetical protein [Mesorhizobium sp. ESP7-2]UCI21687.1 hypothetical protein FJ970_12320 [Mesorhizobium sp. B2-1-8]